MQLKINNLTKIFSGKTVLDIPQLSIKDGELLGIVGNNGAGKTTLFRLCLDLLQAETGSVQIDNQNVDKSEEWKNVTSSFLDERFLIDFLTPMEYFYFVGNLYNVNEKEIDTRIDDFNFFIRDVIDEKRKCIDKFSRGNKQKIGIVASMIIRPKLLILDEPFNFLDPSSQIMIRNIIQTYSKRHGITIILSSHNIQYISDICNRIIILENGVVVRDEKNATPAIKMELDIYFTDISKQKL